MNTILLPVATMTWVYVGGVGRSSGLMSSSVIGLSVLIRCDGGYAGRLLPEAEHGAANPAQAGAPVGCWQHVHPAGRVAADRPFYSGNHVHDVPGIRPGSCSWRLRQDFRHLEPAAGSGPAGTPAPVRLSAGRSEERRVGKECR